MDAMLARVLCAATALASSSLASYSTTSRVDSDRSATTGSQEHFSKASRCCFEPFEGRLLLTTAMPLQVAVVAAVPTRDR